MSKVKGHLLYCMRAVCCCKRLGMLAFLYGLALMNPVATFAQNLPQQEKSAPSSRVRSEQVPRAPGPSPAINQQARPVIPIHRPVHIAAVVNEEVITSAQVEDRALLLIALTGGGDTPQAQAQMLRRALQMLIDETLQLQEAKRYSITVSKQEIDGAIATMEQVRGRPKGALLGFVKASGLSVDSIKRQFEAQVAWNKTVSRKLKRSITITDDEIARAQQMSAQKHGTPQVLIAALSVPIKPEKAGDEKAAAMAESLGKKAAQGFSFDALARDAASDSAAKDAVVVVPPVWIDESRLEPAMAAALRAIDTGQMTKPLRSQQTYQIVKLMDRRDIEPLAADAEIALKQITLAIPSAANAAQIDAIKQAASAVQKNPGSCDENNIGAVDTVKGLEVAVHYQRIKAQQVPANLQPLILPLKVGEVSQPYVTQKGVELTLLCEKIEAPVPLPDKEKIRQRLFAERAQLEAEKYLRNLKRDAFIDIRNTAQASVKQ